MSQVEKRANQVIKPIVENLGYEVVDIEYKNLYGKMNLTVFIYKKGGITLEDCEKVNKELDEPLEENDITLGKNYILNISSPGLDRPFKNIRDYERNIGEKIEVFLKTPLQKADKVVGKLVSVNEEFIDIILKGKPTKIELSNIKKSRPYVKI